MLESREQTTSTREKLVFSENSIKGLIGKLYVTYDTSKTTTSGKENIVPYPATEIRTELMLSYNLNGTPKYLGFKRTSYLDHNKKTVYDGICQVFDQQKPLERGICLFLKRNLPNRMAFLLPEIK